MTYGARAKAAWEDWRGMTSGIHGEHLPPWDQLHPLTQNALIHVALCASSHEDNEDEDEDGDGDKDRGLLDITEIVEEHWVGDVGFARKQTVWRFV